MMTKKRKSEYDSLLDFMAKACMYAQGHIADPQAFDQDIGDRANLLQCTSHQIACFIAQFLDCGVESDVILNELSDNTLNENGFAMKSYEEWVVILHGILIGYDLDN